MLQEPATSKSNTHLYFTSVSKTIFSSPRSIIFTSIPFLVVVFVLILPSLFATLVFSAMINPLDHFQGILYCDAFIGLILE